MKSQNNVHWGELRVKKKTLGIVVWWSNFLLGANVGLAKHIQ